MQVCLGVYVREVWDFLFMACIDFLHFLLDIFLLLIFFPKIILACNLLFLDRYLVVLVNEEKLEHEDFFFQCFS